jgi:trans-2-enoyl-CoA reductase
LTEINSRSLHKHLLPDMKPQDVHVRFLAAPINPADCNQVEGAYPIKPPFTTSLESKEPVAVGGNEGVAEVIALGDQVKDLSVGDKVVMAQAGRGTWRTHAALPASDVQLLPGFNDKVSLVHAATLTVNPSTAYRMLKDFVPLQEGEFGDAICLQVINVFVRTESS